MYVREWGEREQRARKSGDCGRESGADKKKKSE
jgi:hypothetical protein